MIKIENRRQQPKHFVSGWGWLQFCLVFLYLYLLDYPLSRLPSSPVLLCVKKYTKCMKVKKHTHPHTQREGRVRDWK